MDSVDPFSQLAMCCFGRRPRSSAADGFRTVALRNQYYYSPSRAHLNLPAATGTWPAVSGTSHLFAAAGRGAQQAPPSTQQYLLLTQPVIVASSPLAITQASATLGQQHPNLISPGQLQAVPFVANQSPIHKVASFMPSQYAICATATGTNEMVPSEVERMQALAIMGKANTHCSTIYEDPQKGYMTRNVSTYMNTHLGPDCVHQPMTQQTGQLNRQPSQFVTYQKLSQKRLNSDIFKQIELIEKQVNLNEEIGLIERHGIVITRAIDPGSLRPFLTDLSLQRYQDSFLFNDEHKLKFIEIIKRPGQTLGLYIRAVHFEGARPSDMREGIVITKIESDSPVYTSQVLHIGDEILSINLIDTQGMSLDDVVTLMSIPRRLVLALRVPCERDNQATAPSEEGRQEHLLSEQQRIATTNNTRMIDSGLEAQTASQHSPVSTGDEAQLRGRLSAGVNGVMVNSRDFLGDQYSQVGQAYQITRRSDMSGVADQHLGAVDQDQGVEFSSHIGVNTVKGSDDNLRDGKNPNNASIITQPVVRVNGTLCGTLQRGASLDINVSSLNSQSDFVPGSSFNRNSIHGVMESEGDRFSENSANGAQLSGLPKRPVINNIRLGDTPEQSSYFSSSIDAINRELKELRRQRMALSSNDPSVEEWESIINRLRS